MASSWIWRKLHPLNCPCRPSKPYIMNIWQNKVSRDTHRTPPLHFSPMLNVRGSCFDVYDFGGHSDVHGAFTAVLLVPHSAPMDNLPCMTTEQHGYFLDFAKVTPAQLPLPTLQTVYHEYFTK